MKKGILTLLFFALASMGYAQSKTSTYPNFIGQDFATIEANQEWFILKQATGDLNNDGRNDAVIVIESKELVSDIQNDWGDPMNNARIIIVLLDQGGTQKAVIQNNDFIPREDEGGMLPHFEPQLSIEDGALTIENLYTRNAEHYTFRMKGCRFEITEASIGAIEGGTGDYESNTYNFETGEIEVEHGNMHDEETQPVIDIIKFNVTPKSLSEFQKVNQWKITDEKYI